MMNNEEKIYFLPGDVVTLKQDIPNKPMTLADIYNYADEVDFKEEKSFGFV